MVRCFVGLAVAQREGCRHPDVAFVEPAQLPNVPESLYLMGLVLQVLSSWPSLV